MTEKSSDLTPGDRPLKDRVAVIAAVATLSFACGWMIAHLLASGVIDISPKDVYKLVRTLTFAESG